MKKKLDYKWVIVAIALLTILTGTGFTGNRGIYLTAITKALELERSLFSLSDSFRFLTTAILNIFFGTLIVKFGTKKLIIAGYLSLIGAMLLNAVATEVWMFYVAGILLGVGVAWTGTTMIGSVINRWCKEKTGTITGFVMASSGVGIALSSQILTPFILDDNKLFGYRTAYYIVSAVLVVAMVLTLIFYREKPLASGESAVKKKKSRGRAWAGLTYEDTKKKPYYYVSILCIFLTGFVVQGFTSTSSAHFRDVGFSAEVIANLVTVHAVTLILFKFATGMMYDKFGLRFTASICTGAGAVTMALMALLTPTPTGTALAFFVQVLSSVAIPLETVMLPVYAGDLFGQKSFDKIMGLFVASNVFGYAVGVPVMNLWYDSTGSYSGMLMINGFVLIGVVVAMQFVISAAHKTRARIEKEEVEVKL